MNTIIILVIIVFSAPGWLAWQRADANHALLKDLNWALDDLKKLLISREHEAGYVSGTNDERQVGAERAADLAAMAAATAAKAALARNESVVYDADENLVARIKPMTTEGAARE